MSVFDDFMIDETVRRGRELEKLREDLRASQTRTGHLTDRIQLLETALNRMLQAHESLSSDTEGRYPPLDSGCIECTVGTVPDKYNTGLCAYHNAKKLLGHS